VVCAGCSADCLRGLKLRGQDLDVVAPQPDDRLGAQHIHVLSGSIEQDLLCDVAKVLAPGLDIGFCRLHGVHGAEAAKQGLHDADGIAAGIVSTVAGRWRRG